MDDNKNCEVPKIIFVSALTVWSMKEGHGGPAFSQTLKRYINEGWEVFLISDEWLNIKCDFLDRNHNIVLPPNFMKRFAKIRRLGVLFRWADYLLMTKQFCKEIEKILGKNVQNAVLYAYEIYGVKSCSTIAKKYRIPFITRFQGTILSQYKNNWINHIIRYPHYQALSQNADLVIMTNDGTKGLTILRELGNNSKIVFWQNGLELLEMDIKKMRSSFNSSDFRLSLGNIKENECMFLTVSRLTGWKKVERTIDGFVEYCKKRKEGKLIIVGDGDTKIRLMKRVQDYEIADRVIFTGSVAHDDVYKYMIACDVFVSLYDLSNVGNPLLEAMTLGKCIVTLDVGDTGVLIRNRENGILLKREELANLGEILIELADDKALREKMGNAAEYYAKDNFWSWKERMDAELLEVKKMLK